MHRDISAGNIMLDGNSSGILNDCDRAAEAAYCLNGDHVVSEASSGRDDGADTET